MTVPAAAAMLVPVFADNPIFCPDGSIEPVEDGACTIGYECVTDVLW